MAKLSKSSASALIVVALIAAVSFAWWSRWGSEIPIGLVSAPVTSPFESESAIDDAIPVLGNPGWEALDLADRQRAESPLSEDARAWLSVHRQSVGEIARLFNVTPVALGGIVAAEETLLVGRVDAIGEDLLKAVFASLRDRDLERWITDQEETFQREPSLRSGQGIAGLRNPYLWTLGPAQVSLRLALRYEPVVARHLGRPERDAKQVMQAVTTMPGNLEYAAALLATAQRAYAETARMDISQNAGLLATLYHLGSPTVRARRLAEANAARRASGEPPVLPQVNFYGAFVNVHAGEIRALLVDDEDSS